MNVRCSRKELERIKALLENMTYDSAVYHLVKEVLITKGNWKNRRRGKDIKLMVNGFVRNRNTMNSRK